MNEDWVQTIWKYGWFNHDELRTTTGIPVQVIHPGEHNFSSGPDFSHAQLALGFQLWAGTVEIHVKSSDWNKHHHTHDPAYKNVILHVVWEHDDEITLPDGRVLPVLELQHRVDSVLLMQWERLMASTGDFHCRNSWELVPHYVFRKVLEEQGLGRLVEKSDELERYVGKGLEALQELFWQRVFAAAGSKHNKEAFAQLAVQLPMMELERLSLYERLVLLWGASGLLHTRKREEDLEYWCSTFERLRKRFGVTVLSPVCWRFMRVRPANYPTVRIEQLAVILGSATELWLYVTRGAWEQFAETMNTLLRQSALVKSAQSSVASLVRLILINAVAPMMLLLGRQREQSNLQAASVELWNTLKAEEHHYTTTWKEHGVTLKNVTESQGCIRLAREYCRLRFCGHCEIGRTILELSNSGMEETVDAEEPGKSS
jgi:hypothetical protein